MEKEVLREIAAGAEIGNKAANKHKVGNPKPIYFIVDGVKDDFLQTPEKAQQLCSLIDD